MRQYGMQVVKFEYLPYISRVQGNLDYAIVTDTDVEQDVIAFDHLKNRVLAI